MQQVKIVRIDATTLGLRSHYDPELVEEIKRCIPYRSWDREEKLWKLPIDANNLRGLSQMTADVSYCDSLFGLLDRFKHFALKSDSIHHHVTLPIDYRIVGEFTLKKFQVEGVQYLVNHPKAMFWDDMGLGKTIQAICTIEYKSVFPCVVVCPAGLKDNWSGEWGKINPGRNIQILRSKKDINPDADVYIVSYDNLEGYLVDLLSQFPLSLIADESQEIKSFKSKRFKLLKRLSSQVPVRYLMTGTPVMNRPSELIAPLMILDLLDEVFGGFEQFICRYCNARKTPFGWDYRGSSNTEELNSRLTKLCTLRRTKEQVIDELPSKSVIDKYLDIDNRNEYLLEYFNMRQFRDGLDVTEGVAWMDRLRKLSALGKLNEYFRWADMIVAGGEKLVIFAYHTEVINRIQEHFDCDVVDGNVSDKKKQKAVRAFQADPNKKVIVLNLRSGGLGWTLTSACIVSFLEFDWSPKIMQQAEDRVHRIGATRPVSCYYFIGKNTIDELMMGVLGMKNKDANSVTDEHLTVKQELFDLLQQSNNLAA